MTVLTREICFLNYFKPVFNFWCLWPLETVPFNFLYIFFFFWEFFGANPLRFTSGFGAASSRKDLLWKRTPINPNQELPETQATKTWGSRSSDMTLCYPFISVLLPLRPSVQRPIFLFIDCIELLHFSLNLYLHSLGAKVLLNLAHSAVFLAAFWTTLRYIASSWQIDWVLLCWLLTCLQYFWESPFTFIF